MRLDRVRLLTAIGIAVFLTLFWWGVFTLTSSAADLMQPTVRLAHIPGSKKNLTMPPEAMQRKIVALMQKGRAPAYKSIPKAELEAACGHQNIEWVLLGCTTNSPLVRLQYGVDVVIWSGLKGTDRHYVLVHEYAHKLYGWTH